MPKEIKRTPAKWNGVDYYVMFGDPTRRSWEDGRAFGYVAAGGNRRWSNPLKRLWPGARVFAHRPGDGYVGIGRVLREMLPITEFVVTVSGRQVPILEIPLRNDRLKDDADDPDRREYVVPVRWEWAVPAGQGFWARDFFFVRTTVFEFGCPQTARQVCEHAGISYDT